MIMTPKNIFDEPALFLEFLKREADLSPGVDFEGHVSPGTRIVGEPDMLYKFVDRTATKLKREADACLQERQQITERGHVGVGHLMEFLSSLPGDNDGNIH